MVFTRVFTFDYFSVTSDFSKNECVALIKKGENMFPNMCNIIYETSHTPQKFCSGFFTLSR